MTRVVACSDPRTGHSCEARRVEHPFREARGLGNDPFCADPFGLLLAHPTEEHQLLVGVLHDALLVHSTTAGGVVPSEEVDFHADLLSLRPVGEDVRRVLVVQIGHRGS